MWAWPVILVLAFALGWFVPHPRAFWAPVLLGSAGVVVNLTSDDRETHWIYGFILGAGVAVIVGVVVLMGIALRRATAGKRRGRGRLDPR